MPIKNYRSRMPVDQSIAKIQAALVKSGASGVFYEYEQGTGRVLALKFVLPVGEQQIGFSLPVQWRRFQAVLKEQKVTGHGDEAFCYRVAWSCLRDWVLAQMALYETQMVKLPQIFLPFAVDKSGQTLYDRVEQGKLLLGDGSGS